MRQNHTHHSPASRLETFDRVYIELPEGSNTATITIVPMKTIYINRCAAPWENVDRVFHDIEDAEEFMGMLGLD